MALVDAGMVILLARWVSVRNQEVLLVSARRLPC